MNIKDFLIENYIWLIVIVLITIVTIIGFLADKKRVNNKEKKAKVAPQNTQTANEKQPDFMQTTEQPINNVQPIQYQQPQPAQLNQVNNNMGMNFNNINTTVRPINQTNTETVPQPINYTEPQVIEPMNNQQKTITSPQPVENIPQNPVQEPMYQPLSEQKPIIAPQPVPNFSNVQPQNNPEVNQVVQNPINMQPLPSQINVIQPVTETMMPSPVPMVNNNFAQTPNFIPNNVTIPQAVNPIPAPQPINPQSIQNNPNQAGNMQQMNMMQPNPNMIQPTQNTIPQPINFVYGPQNNNQNM